MKNEWRNSMQMIIEWIENNIEDQPTLSKMSREVGYSPYYCSYLFHEVTGTTIKKYLADRKLTFAAIALRDTKERILDIAITYGFSSQEALTRAFVRRFGCTPNVYRKNPIPLKFSIKPQLLFPNENDINGGNDMKSLREANVRFEHLPAHKYIGIWEPRADNYGDFWKYHDCDEICGIIESMRHVALEVVGSHMAGWYNEDGKKGYFYGFGVPYDYNGHIPEGFEMREFPACSYMVFYHPAFEYLDDNSEVMKRVEDLAWNFNLKSNDHWWIPNDYEWNETQCQTYQRHFPEVIGYEVLRPVKKIMK